MGQNQASVPSHLDRLWQCPSRRVVSEERRVDTSPSLAGSRSVAISRLREAMGCKSLASEICFWFSSFFLCFLLFIFHRFHSFLIGPSTVHELPAALPQINMLNRISHKNPFLLDPFAPGYRFTLLCQLLFILMPFRSLCCLLQDIPELVDQAWFWPWWSTALLIYCLYILRSKNWQLTEHVQDQTKPRGHLANVLTWCDTLRRVLKSMCYIVLHPVLDSRSTRLFTSQRQRPSPTWHEGTNSYKAIQCYTRVASASL